MDSEEKKEQTYPLHKVIRCRNIHKLKILLNCTKDINLKNELGYSPLLYACEQEKNDKILEFLLEHKDIDPLATDNDFQNALHILAFKGQLSWIKHFLEKFPTMHVDEITKKGDTPLIMAAKMDHDDIIEFLHERGANVNHKNSKNFTALHYAANNGYINSTKKLLELGADIKAKDDRKCTPLIKCCSWNFKETAKILLEHGADVDAQDMLGNSALSLAARRRYFEIAQLLLENNANPNIITRTEYYISYTPVITACKNNDIDLLKLLIKYGGKVNFPDDYCQALFMCIKNGQHELVVELIKAGADLFGKHPLSGKTPLEHAIKNKKSDIASLIRQNM